MDCVIEKEELPENFYELDGFQQLMICGCNECQNILKTQDIFFLEKTPVNHAVDVIRSMRNDRWHGYIHYKKFMFNVLQIYPADPGET